MTLLDKLIYRALLFENHRDSSRPAAERYAAAVESATLFLAQREAANGGPLTDEEAAPNAELSAKVDALSAAVAAIPPTPEIPADQSAEIARLNELLAALAADVEAVKAAQVPISVELPSADQTGIVTETPPPTPEGDPIPLEPVVETPAAIETPAPAAEVITPAPESVPPTEET